MIDVAWEPLGILLRDGLEDLCHENWEEVETDRDIGPLIVDWKHYLQIERQGVYRTIGARVSGELVGYNAFFLNRHTRAMHTVHAINDLIYLHPDHRKGWNGYRLIRQSERLLKEASAVKVQYAINLHVRRGARGGTVGDLLGHLGYRHVRDIYTKVL